MCVYIPLCEPTYLQLHLGTEGEYTYKLSQQQGREKGGVKAKNVPSASQKVLPTFTRLPK